MLAYFVRNDKSLFFIQKSFIKIYKNEIFITIDSVELEMYFFKFFLILDYKDYHYKDRIITKTRWDMCKIK